MYIIHYHIWRGLHGDSTGTPRGLHGDSMGTPQDFEGIIMTFEQVMQSPWGVHGNMWGTVKYSTTLWIVDHPLVLIHIVTGLIFGHPSVIGYDETIQCGSHGKAHTVRVGGFDYRVPGWIIQVSCSVWTGNKMLECREHRWAQRRICCERLLGWREIEILELIQELGLCESCCVPRLVHGEAVPVLLNVKSGTRGDDCTARCHGDNSSVEGRIHCQLLMKPVGRYITDFRCLHELVGAIIDAVEGTSLLIFY